MTGFNTEIDNLKLKREDEQTIYNRIQSESFQVAAEIARAEKDIEYTEQIETSKKDNIEDINSDIEKAKKEIKELNEKKEHNVSELKKSIEENHRLSTSIDDINKNIKDSSFALQNWQSNFNKFLSDKIELEKEIELEKSKIESFSENISSLKKRLDQYSDMSDRNDDTNIQVELLDLSESYQKQLINFKVDQERYSKGLPNNERKSLSNLLNNLIDKFKTIIIKIKENNKSLDQQRKEIKNTIKSYQDKITNCESILLGYNTNLKNFTEHKNKLEKQKIDLKQAYDKSNWKFNELSENLNSNNVTVSTLKTQIASFDENISRLNVNIDVLTNKKQELLSESNHPIKSDTRNKLNALINKKKRKMRLLQRFRTKYQQSITKYIRSLTL